ncbi:MAG TPA: hypothetical protein PKB05_04235 [Oligoflexia bacterium]|nr:hypothetical protein [Oligoflexia bacterium]
MAYTNYTVYAQNQDCFYLLIASTEREIQTESTQGSQDLDCGFSHHIRPSITHNDYHETKTTNNDTITCLNYLKRSTLWVSETPEYLDPQVNQSKKNSQLYYSGKVCGEQIEHDLHTLAKNVQSYSLDQFLQTNFVFSQNHLPQAIYKDSELSWTIPNLNIQCNCTIKSVGTLKCSIESLDNFKD